MIARTLLVFLAFHFFSSSAQQVQVKEPAATNSQWTQPYPPFRIAGNLYYVGTYDLACYLITTSKGNILINTGLASSAVQIEKSIEDLGFKLSDVKILLTTQAHHDHTGALAAIKKKTGAKLMADAEDAAVLADGGNSDYAFGGNGATFEPVKVDRLLRDNDIISLGEMKLTLLHHPGHTKGSCSYLFRVSELEKSYQVLIANMPTIVVDKPFSEVKSYPTISADYARTLQAMKGLSFDLWLASHASQFKLHEKHKPGDAYNPEVFIDKQGYLNALAGFQKVYDDKEK